MGNNEVFMDKMICLEHTSKLAKVGMAGNGYAVRELDLLCVCNC